MNEELSFVRLIFRTFFSWWWAVITGAASLLSYLETPSKGVTISRMWYSLAILGCMALLFFTFSCVYQAWRMYKGHYRQARVLRFAKDVSFDSTYMCLIDGLVSPKDSIIEIRFRNSKGIEAPLALARVMGVNSNNQHQACVIWSSPALINEFYKNGSQCHELMVATDVGVSTIMKAKDTIFNYKGDLYA